MSDSYVRTFPEARKALRACKNVYIAVMFGNAGYAVRIPKREAAALLSHTQKTFKDLDGLGMHALGFVDGDDMHLGGL